MKAKTITAKLRDAVPVCFMVNGDEMTRYRNIDIPESLKELEIRDFGFQVLADGKIEFNLHFEPGVLPTEFSGIRPKISRARKSAAKAMVQARSQIFSIPETRTEPELQVELEAQPDTKSRSQLRQAPNRSHNLKQLYNPISSPKREPRNRSESRAGSNL